MILVIPTTAFDLWLPQIIIAGIAVAVAYKLMSEIGWNDE